MLSRDALRHNFLRNALYHTARRRVLEGWSRLSNFVVLALGTTSAADALVGFGISQGLLGLAVAIVAAMQFAFDWSGRARTHEFLQRRNYEVLAQIETKPELAKRQGAEFQGQISLLSAEEPPTHRALDAMAYNEALDSIYGAGGADSRLVVPVWQVPLVHILHFNGSNYRSTAERAELRSRSWWATHFRRAGLR
ncbi:MAG: hypothetical protein ACK8QZ_06890 [Anaerolineales bacterium]